MTRRILMSIAALLLAACAQAPAANSAAPTQSAVTSASSAAPASAGARSGAATFTVGNASKATVSVREQLVGVNLPSDAILTATGATGAFTVNPDGTFTSDSKISFDLSTLQSDQRDRDNFVKQNTLEVRRFPTVTFVPTKATGLTFPIPADTDLTFTLAGEMTIHGVTRDVTFDVTAARAGSQLKATATANPTWKFGDFGMRVPSVAFRVVSVNDEIRVVVDLVATAANA